MADFFSLGIATKKKPLMARKVVNRKALREEAEAAAQAEGATKTAKKKENPCKAKDPSEETRKSNPHENILGSL